MKRLLFVLAVLLSIPCPSLAAAPDGKSSWVNGRSYEGEVLDADYPVELHFWNIGSHVDGAGMCVMTSIEMSALYAGLDHWKGLRDWCAQQPGGGYPSKVEKQLAAFAKAKGFPVDPHLQYEGADPGPIYDRIARQGLVACSTYGYSPRYGSQTIAHMICVPHYGAKFGVVMDNNKIGGVDDEHLFEWMSTAELVKRAKHPNGSAWVFAWCVPPPPPLPK